MLPNPFQNISTNFVRSPLGIIALFIVLVYAMATTITAIGDLPDLDLLILVIFLVAFPVLVLGVFYRLVTKHPDIIYGPADFREDTSFLAYRGAADTETEKLRAYWKPDGSAIDPDHTNGLVGWMRTNDIRDVTVPQFLRSPQYADARRKAAADLGLT